MCDDVTVERAGGAMRLQPDCDLGAAWFSECFAGAADAPAATIRGQPADVDAALRRAAELLREARRPLLYGFHRATVEDVRAAVALADRLGALVATNDPDAPWPRNARNCPPRFSNLSTPCRVAPGATKRSSARN